MNINNKKGYDNVKNTNLKGFLLLTFSLTILIILIQNISAIQIDIKEQYSQDETLIAQITGNFIDAFTSNNVLFYKGHVRIPMQFTLTKIDSDYYLYALLLGKSPDNYSLQIQDVRYKIGTQIHDEDVIKNFTITNISADFYVVPGFVKTNDSFSLEVTNLRDNKIEIKVISENNSDSEEGFFESLFGTENTTQTIELNAGQSKEISFDFDSLRGDLNESDFKAIILESENTSYSIPVYLEVDNKTSKKDKETGELSFEHDSINISAATNSNITRIIYLFNKEDAPVENISLYVSDDLKQYINIFPANVSELDENSSMKIELIIYSEETEGTLSGQLIAKYKNLSNSEELFAKSDIFLRFINDYVSTYEDNATVIDTKTCAELEGFICNSTIQTCPGKSVYAKDNNCCLEECKTIEEKSSTGKYLGWGMVGLVVIFLVWFFLKRYRRTKTSVDLLKVASGKR